MIFAVVCYMSAFTASSFDLMISAELDGLQETNTNTCHPFTWEYVTQTSEIIILVFGLHLGIASRNADTQFRVPFLVINSCVATKNVIFQILGETIPCGFITNGMPSVN